MWSGATDNTTATVNYSMSTGTWHYVEAFRSSGVDTLCVDGSSIGTVSDHAIGNSGTTMGYGAQSTAGAFSAYFTGNLYGFRISNNNRGGSCLAVPSSPYTNLSLVTPTLNFSASGASLANIQANGGTNVLTVTNNGNTALSIGSTGAVTAPVSLTVGTISTSGLVNAGSANQLAYYNGAGSAVSGSSTFTTSTVAVLGTGQTFSALQKYSSGAEITSLRKATGTVVTNSTASLTLTGANMAKNAIFQETGSTAATFTLDTGTNLSTAVAGVVVGDEVEFTVSNASTATITMAGASGTTLANVMTVATLQSRTFHAINTGSNAWTIY